MSSENGYPAEKSTAEQLSDVDEQILSLTSKLTDLMHHRKALQRQLLDEAYKNRQL